MRLEVKGKYDYNSGHEDDLSFNAGQIIAVTEEVDDEWYQGEYTDGEGHLHQGMFPRNFVIPLKTRSASAGTSSSVSGLEQDQTTASLRPDVNSGRLEAVPGAVSVEPATTHFTSRSKLTSAPLAENPNVPQPVTFCRASPV